MSGSHFSTRDNAELRAKIDKAKAVLPLPSLMRQLGCHEKHIGKTALCPFHDDHKPSFSVFQKNGAWFHRCWIGCSSGDEIAFLVKHFGISRREAIKRYLTMAGFPPNSSPKSHEYPVAPKSREYPKSPASLSISVSQFPEFPESPCVSVSPVSEGQAPLDQQLTALAARNACSRVSDRAGKKRFKLTRFEGASKTDRPQSDH